MIDYELDEIENKLEKTCKDNDLVFKFETINFPIVATVRQSEEKKNQMVLEEVEEENKVYGEIKFIFGNELSISISDDFVISDDVLNKLKNNFKKLHYLYLQIYFRTAKARK